MNYVGTLLGLGIGLMFVGILVGILYYVAFSWSHMKALKALGYDKAWLAWIPFGVLFACSDATVLKFRQPYSSSGGLLSWHCGYCHCPDRLLL